MDVVLHGKFCAWSQVGTCAYGPVSQQWDLAEPRAVTEEPP